LNSSVDEVSDSVKASAAFLMEKAFGSY